MDPTASPIRVALANPAEFQKFQCFPNEQRAIRTGALLCPKPQFFVANLETTVEYQMSLKFRKVSDKRWKYDQFHGWRETEIVQTSLTDEEHNQFVLGIKRGQEWLTSGINFHLKLTNHPGFTSSDTVYVMGFSKYQPILVVSPVERVDHGYRFDGTPLEFMFQSMEFITVTHYYNPLVSDAKCEIHKCPDRHARKVRTEALKSMDPELPPVIRKRIREEDAAEKKKSLRKLRADRKKQLA